MAGARVKLSKVTIWRSGIFKKSVPELNRRGKARGQELSDAGTTQEVGYKARTMQMGPMGPHGAVLNHNTRTCGTGKTLSMRSLCVMTRPLSL